MKKLENVKLKKSSLYVNQKKKFTPKNINPNHISQALRSIQMVNFKIKVEGMKKMENMKIKKSSLYGI